MLHFPNDRSEVPSDAIPIELEGVVDLFQVRASQAKEVRPLSHFSHSDTSGARGFGTRHERPLVDSLWHLIRLSYRSIVARLETIAATASAISSLLIEDELNTAS